MAKQNRSVVAGDGLMAWEGGGATMWLTVAFNDYGVGDNGGVNGDGGVD